MATVARMRAQDVRAGDEIQFWGRFCKVLAVGAAARESELTLKFGEGSSLSYQKNESVVVRRRDSGTSYRIVRGLPIEGI